MNKMKTGIAIAALALMSSVAQASAFTNGGFEDSTFSGGFATYGAGSTMLTGWTITAGSVDLINTYWVPSEGNYSLDLNGGTDGSIAQTFDTVANQTYTVSFDLAGNPAGGGDKSLIAGVTNGNFYTFSIAGKSTANMGWTTKSFSFTATGTSSTLYFSGWNGNGAYGAALDNISVTAVPEPGTYAMLLAGLGLMGVVARRKKSA